MLPRTLTYTHLSLGTVLKVFCGVALVGALTWYGFFQARFLIAGPLLTLDPMSPNVSARVVAITGTAKNVTAITLNGRSIFTDDEGNFKEGLVLEDGYTIMTLRAEDRYGHEVTLSRELVYTPAYEG